MQRVWDGDDHTLRAVGEHVPVVGPVRHTQSGGQFFATRRRLAQRDETCCIAFQDLVDMDSTYLTDADDGEAGLVR